MSSALSFKADCHCHSYYSDGSLAPEALVNLALAQGLDALAITDHDSLQAYATAPTYAKSLGLEMISGIELSTQWLGEDIHVLGYAFDLKNPALQDFCQQMTIVRQARVREILARLEQQGIEIAYQSLVEKFPHRQLGRPHIAQMLVAAGVVTHSAQAFERYLGQDKSCYISTSANFIATNAAIELIHQAGGFAILAHPHCIRNPLVLESLLQLNFNGIEVFYSKLTTNQCKRFKKIATEKKWLSTGGSDFHQPNAGVNLGQSLTPPEVFQQFLSRFASFC